MADDCPQCQGRGWILHIYPSRKPVPAYWFTRGPQGQRPYPCDKCSDATEGATP